MAVGDINRVAQGLLDIFDAKTGGRGPARWLDEVRPTVETLDMFAAERVVHLAVQANLNDVTRQVQLFVPDSTIWLVMAFSIRLAFNALGQTARASIAMERQGEKVDLSSSSVLVTAVSLNDTLRVGQFFRPPFWAQAGDILQGQVQEIGLAGQPSIPSNCIARVAEFGPGASAATP